MEIKFDKLSLNQYTDDDFKANNFIVKLGEPKDLLNVETEYGNDVCANDLSFGVIDKESNEYFSLFFLSSKTNENGNIEYTINKIIFDEKLSDDAICICCQQSLSKIDCHETIKYAINAYKQYGYYKTTKDIAVSQVVESITQQAKLMRYGMGTFPDILQGIADNFNKHK